MGINSGKHREILEDYGEKVLDQMIAVVTACTIISYVLYTVDPGTVEKFDSTGLIWTVPFVIYGIFRYLYLVYQRNLGGRPEMVLLADRPMIISVFLWILVSIYIVY